MHSSVRSSTVKQLVYFLGSSSVHSDDKNINVVVSESGNDSGRIRVVDSGNGAAIDCSVAAVMALDGSDVVFTGCEEGFDHVAA